MGSTKEFMFDVVEEIISNYLDIQSLDTMDDKRKEDTIYNVVEAYLEEIQDSDIVKAVFIRENIEDIISFIIGIVEDK